MTVQLLVHSGELSGNQVSREGHRSKKRPANCARPSSLLTFYNFLPLYQLSTSGAGGGELMH